MSLKKTHKTKIKNLSYSNHLLKIGSYGFKILSNLRLTEKQKLNLERILKTKLKKMFNPLSKYKVASNLTFNKTLTKLSLESRMGKGKGSVYTKVLYLKKGTIIYELSNLKYLQIKELLTFIEKYLQTNLLLVQKK